jgi:hypothetical protein
MKTNIFLCAAFIATAFSLSAQDNIQWRGVDRTGIYHEAGLLQTWPTAGPQLLWHYDGLGEGHTSVAIDANKIYLTGLADGNGYIFVFDLNGKLLQKKAYGPEWKESYNGPRGTMTINEGNIYLISGLGELY